MKEKKGEIKTSVEEIFNRFIVDSKLQNHKKEIVEYIRDHFSEKEIILDKGNCQLENILNLLKKLEDYLADQGLEISEETEIVIL